MPQMMAAAPMHMQTRAEPELVTEEEPQGVCMLGVIIAPIFSKAECAYALKGPGLLRELLWRDHPGRLTSPSLC